MRKLGAIFYTFNIDAHLVAGSLQNGTKWICDLILIAETKKNNLYAKQKNQLYAVDFYYCSNETCPL